MRPGWLFGSSTEPLGDNGGLEFTVGETSVIGVEPAA